MEPIARGKSWGGRKTPKRCDRLSSTTLILCVTACLIACLSAYNFGILIGQLLSDGEQQKCERMGPPADSDPHHPAEIEGKDGIGARVKPQLQLPNVLLVGAQKAGTTALASMLYQSGVCKPEVFGNDPAYYSKEVHFFDRPNRFRQGPSFYARRFRHCANSNLAMDATPAYFSFADRIRTTYDAVGNNQSEGLKILMIIREPIARELSVYNHKAYMYGKNKHNNTFANDIAWENGDILSFAEYAERTRGHINPNGTCRSEKQRARPYSFQYCFGLYASHLENWLKFFDSTNILVLAYDELLSDEEQIKRRVQMFLNFEKDVQMGKIEKRNVKKSGNKIDLPSCSMQSKLVATYRASNEALYKLLRTKSEPEMEQRPFPRFTVSNCTVVSYRNSRDKVA
mmetsp:Transcript_7232/g.21459  ORF Transcript_7232/g.21459 Transcript_7232/m.21459 type:complete len:399 (-) Transcript_7232:495-1691(-)